MGTPTAAASNDKDSTVADCPDLTWKDMDLKQCQQAWGRVDKPWSSLILASSWLS